MKAQKQRVVNWEIQCYICILYIWEEGSRWRRPTNSTRLRCPRWMPFLSQLRIRRRTNIHGK